MNLKKPNSTIDQFIDVQLNSLNDGYNCISIAKYNDLQSLLKYIPARYHTFYRNIKTDESNYDDDYNLTSEDEQTNEC